jgi:hypothetical protein
MRSMLLAISAVLAVIALTVPASACFTTREQIQVCSDSSGCNESIPYYKCYSSNIGGEYCSTGFGLCCSREYRTDAAVISCPASVVANRRVPDGSLASVRHRKRDQITILLVPDSCNGGGYGVLAIAPDGRPVNISGPKNRSSNGVGGQ